MNYWHVYSGKPSISWEVYSPCGPSFRGEKQQDTKMEMVPADKYVYTVFWQIRSGESHRKAIWLPQMASVALQYCFSSVADCTPPGDRLTNRLKLNKLCFDGERDREHPSDLVYGGTYFLQQACYLKSHAVRALSVAHKIVLSLSAGSRHRWEPGLAGLWGILFLLQDDFYTQRPLPDYDLLQQPERSLGSARPCSLSGNWAEGINESHRSVISGETIASCVCLFHRFYAPDFH